MSNLKPLSVYILPDNPEQSKQQQQQPKSNGEVQGTLNTLTMVAQT